MALPNDGPLSLSDIQGEFGGTNPISLSEYYNKSGSPASGTISVQDFYGLANVFDIAYLLVGGGGGGGDSYCNRGCALTGGGASGVVKEDSIVDVAGPITYDITVGTGGASNTEGTASQLQVSGGSVVESANGGGRGCGFNSGGSLISATSGGGGSQGNPGATRPDGGDGFTNSGQGCGGGGAVGDGGNQANSQGTDLTGGIGYQSSITGTATYYGGGGGGGTSATVQDGGLGGGGNGANSSVLAVDGVDGLGGGGGGSTNGFAGGSGGDGVVIISVPTANAASGTTGSPTITTSGSNTIYTFLGSGTITFG